MIDQFGGEANNQSIQYMKGNGLTAQPKVSLFLFSQREIPDQYRRAHTYNFDGEFRIDLQNNIEKSVKGYPYNHLDAFMPESLSAKHAILPAAQGEHIRLHEFNDFWTFILVVDNGNTPSVLGTRSFPGRCIYSGWVTDEPVYPDNIGRGVIPNPSAVFCISHNTVITCPSILSPSGWVNKPDVTGDYDYLPGQVAQQLQVNNNNLYILTPKMLISSMIPEDDHSYTLNPTPIAAWPKNIEINTDINNPSQHLNTLVGGAVDTVKMTGHNPNVPDIIDSFSNMTVLQSLGANVSSGLNIIPTAIDPKEPLPFSVLLQMFNNDIDITVCKRPFECHYDRSSGAEVSRRNVFTSLLATAIPSIMAMCSLAEVAFRFNSYEKPDGGLGSIGTERGIFQVMNIAPLYMCDPTGVNALWDQFTYQLKNTIFPMIISNGGHFDLTMHCSLAGASLINLIMYDEMREPGLIETNNLLGGLNTPLIGGLGLIQGNAAQLYSVVQDITNNNSGSYEQYNYPIY